MSDEKVSRFRKHQVFLGIDRQTKINKTSQLEKNTIEAIQLPPLVLEKKSKFLNIHWLTSVTLAAAGLLFAIFSRPESQPPYTFKGSEQVRLSILRQSQQVDYQRGQLQAGDKITATVTVTNPMEVYFSVVNRHGQSLMTNNEIRQTQLTLEAGQSASFANSITLSTDNDGEALIVYLCQQSLVTNRELAIKAFLDSCTQKLFKLRP